MDFHELPEHFSRHSLKLETLEQDPIAQLLDWMREAKNCQLEELNAMALATAGADAIPSCRMVLLKQVDHNGLVFYTNRDSRKAQELEENPYAAATIFWPKMMRQIGIEGKVEKVMDEESQAYFRSRQRQSQIASWASKQGKKLSSRQELLDSFAQMKQKFAGKEIPLPPFWGGYRLVPCRFEFWLGGEFRLHDRIEYRLHNHLWERSRLSP